MESLLKKFLKKNTEHKVCIHCVGDAMIDEYYEVNVDRISPEFPMPIMSSSEGTPIRRPGGAANVAYQFRHFNVDPTLVCLSGDKQATRVFDDHGIRMLHPSPSSGCAQLPIKRRFLDRGIQVTRHDIEKPLCNLKEDELQDAEQQVRYAIGRARRPDVASFSDYNKGFFATCSYLDCYRDAITIVDAKHGPLAKWKGCDIFKPNAVEAAQLSGRRTWREQAQHLQDELECEAVVITSGGEKVAGIWKLEFFEYRPERKVGVRSVVGAGDCFGAFFAAAVGHGFAVPEAAEIAWQAGAVYVQDNMNRPVVPAELSPDGIVTPEDLVQRDFKLVFTNGCFDLLHEGHIQTLRFAKEKGDRLVVAVNSDESVRRLKGESRPIKTLQQRMAVLAALEMVDFVVSFDEDTPLEIIKTIRPDVLVKGADYNQRDIVGADIVRRVYQAPLLRGLSTTGFLSKSRANTFRGKATSGIVE
ncbi:MAG: bifunctional heptose 7-phosphate kinase/heptose 1-phosphate adenyltransferase [Planctomycetes bacterium]|nr:bifunctional heptose 7-phosphate kinase/heptose 1-phosphate adenyltransferase [Planctomycetota bacterium]